MNNPHDRRIRVLLGVLLILASSCIGAAGYSIPWRSVKLIADDETSLLIESTPIDHRLNKVVFQSQDRTCALSPNLMAGIYGVAPERAQLNFSFSVPVDRDEEAITIVEIVIPIVLPESPRFSGDFDAMVVWISGFDGCDTTVQFFEYKDHSRGARLNRDQVFEFDP